MYTYICINSISKLIDTLISVCIYIHILFTSRESVGASSDALGAPRRAVPSVVGLPIGAKFDAGVPVGGVQKRG